jgi:dTDP-4-dehydrorhamnose reductase
MRTFVVGASGLVGSIVKGLFEENGHDVLGSSHSSDACSVSLDKRDRGDVRTVVNEYNPDVIVDTAAFHAVDKCERDRDAAWQVNAAGTRNVAVAADEVAAQYLFLSTDYVFPGVPGEAPYAERDPIRPVNYYGETKYSGEQAAKIADDWTVLRPSVIYGLASSNFVTWAIDELSAGNQVDIVDDQISRPTYAPDLGRACLEIAQRSLTGVYHATGPESLSRYEFVIDLADCYGFEHDLVSPISSEEFGQSADRPDDSSLDSRTLYDAVGFEFRSPREAFREMANVAE